MVELSNMLYKARSKKSLSQKALATQLGYTTSQFVSNWERGTSKPPAKIIPRLCELLGLSEKRIYKILEDEFAAKLRKAK